MTRDLLVLQATQGEGKREELVREAAKAIKIAGFWEIFVELRMAAGPTIRITPLTDGEDPYQVVVTWGSQRAESTVSTLEHAIEVADRLGNVFYEIRLDSSRGSLV